jgi:hypothetical protein
MVKEQQTLMTKCPITLNMFQILAQLFYSFPGIGWNLDRILIVLFVFWQDLYRILTEPEVNMVKQQQMSMTT